ncbi:MAG TPA: hypothetical protein P5076_21660, partial [Myxococcota bacterium]|nr:hypothetical protein [Myxococcota bacterium]
EWLSEVVFYVTYAHLGTFGLVALGTLLNTLACALVYRLTTRYTESPFASALITFMVALMMMGNYSLRPYLFGNLFFLGALHLVEEPSAGGRLRPVLVFLLFTAWANFHGSFILGLSLMLLYMAASLVAQLRAPRRTFAPLRALGIDLAVGIAACMVTPHHVYGFLFPFMYLKNAFTGQLSFLTNISEWQPAGFDTPLGRMITFFVLFCLFAIAGSMASPTPAHIGLLVAFTIFAYSTVRNIPLLGIAAAPALARHLPKAIGRVGRLFGQAGEEPGLLARFHRRCVAAERRAWKSSLPALAALVLLVGFLAPTAPLVGYQGRTGVEELSDLSPDFYPAGLLAVLERQASPRRTFNYFNWGGAFIWRLYPRQQVFIDQRNDCYPLDVFVDYFAVHDLEPDWRAVLERWGIEQIAYPPDSRLARALRDEPGWTVTYQDDQAVLFERLPPPAEPAEEEYEELLPLPDHF